MLGLLKWVIGLTVLLSALIVLARVAAPPDVYAFPLNSINLTPDCQLPCWHGIIPGVTTRAEVLAIFNADPAYLIIETDNVNSLNVRHLNPSSNKDTYLGFAENSVVYDIQLYGVDTLYHTVIRLGKPIAAAESYCSIELVWARATVIIGPMDTGQLEANMTTNPLTVRVTAPYLTDPFTSSMASLEGGYLAARWQGFHSRYTHAYQLENCYW